VSGDLNATYMNLYHSDELQEMAAARGKLQCAKSRVCQIVKQHPAWPAGSVPAGSYRWRAAIIEGDRAGYHVAKRAWKPSRTRRLPRRALTGT